MRRIALHGELDVGTALDVRSTLRSAEAAHAKAVVVDLGELTFIDSAGVSEIVAAARRARGRFDFRIENEPPPFARVVDILGLRTDLARPRN